MNKIIILILCLCCAFTIARAEEGPALNPSDANIVGHVVDRKTGEHLSFITIFLKGTTIGTSTDGTGHYYLKNLPEGEFTVVMKTMGYKTIETPVMLKKGRTLEINFEVEEEALSLDGVVVSANRNETTRRMAPSLVNVLDSKMFETTHATSLADGLNSSRACGWKTIARTAVSNRCVSMDWKVLTRRYWWIVVPYSVH